MATCWGKSRLLKAYWNLLLFYLIIIYIRLGRSVQRPQCCGLCTRPVVVKKELSQKAKLSIYWSIYVPTLTYGHELCVVTERTRSRTKVAEMGFLRRMSGLSLRDRVRSSVIREGLGVEPLH